MPGFTLWLTGLPGSGKTTIAYLVAAELEKRGRVVDVFDGDVVRPHLSQGLGFSRGDRDTNIGRIGWVASRVARAGAVSVVAAISPYAEARAVARAMTEEFAPFFEVWVATPVTVCAARDPKGLYARAYAGALTGMTGVDDPYEAPAAPDAVLDTSAESPDESAKRLLAALAAADLLDD